LRIERWLRWLRWLVYAILMVLFTTGLAWWRLDAEPGVLRTYLIAAHGLGAMLFLMAMGAIIVLHVRESWRRKRNRSSGVLVVATLGVLVTTAFGLYYFGSDRPRDICLRPAFGGGTGLASSDHRSCRHGHTVATGPRRQWPVVSLPAAQIRFFEAQGRRQTGRAARAPFPVKTPKIPLAGNGVY